MESTAFLSHYDASARSDRLVEFEQTQRSLFPELDEVALDLEQRARLFGSVIVDVSNSADSLRSIQDRDEKIAAIDDDTYKQFEDSYIPSIEGYFKWLDNQYKRDIEPKIIDWHSSANEKLANFAVNRFIHTQLHDLNSAARFQWHKFARVGLIGEGPTKEMLRTNQELLAFVGLLYIRQREILLLNKGYRKSEYLTGLSKQHINKENLEGTLNELDAGIALLQASIDNPDGSWWVLPAPPQFEYLAGRTNNADFLIVDAARGRSLGVQVKSSGMVEEREKLTDSDQIIYVSGRYDLGNSMTVDRKVEGYDTYSYAGGLTMAVLSQLNPKSSLSKFLGREPHLKWAYGHARSKGNPKTLKGASERVTYRIDGHL